MNAELMSQIVTALLGLLSAIVTGFLIPYLKQKYDLDKRVKAYQTVQIVVQSVEQMAMVMGWDGKAKKAQALKMLESLGIKLSNTELDVMLESAVLELSKLKKKVIEP